MILAGDIGGTKARIGIFERKAERLELIFSEQYSSPAFASLEQILKNFLDQHRSKLTSPLEAGCFGLPGPVVNGRVKVTNLPWEVAQSDVAGALGITKVKLTNDLVSTAAAVPTFGPQSLETIYDGAGSVDRSASCVVVAPGTGLGHALIHREAGWSVLLASEGGHANFAPTDELEIELLRYLKRKLTHVSVETLLSGPGLVSIFSFLCDTGRGECPDALRCESSPSDRAAQIAAMALAGESDLCLAAVNTFCSILGAHCSNILLTFLATGGVFLGGGIPPKILPILQQGAFMEGYLRKGKQRERVEATPVYVIKDDYAALYGSAAIAATL